MLSIVNRIDDSSKTRESWVEDRFVDRDDQSLMEFDHSKYVEICIIRFYHIEIRFDERVIITKIEDNSAHTNV